MNRFLASWRLAGASSPCSGGSSRSRFCRFVSSNPSSTRSSGLSQDLAAFLAALDLGLRLLAEPKHRRPFGLPGEADGNTGFFGSSPRQGSYPLGVVRFLQLNFSPNVPIQLTDSLPVKRHLFFTDSGAGGWSDGPFELVLGEWPELLGHGDPHLLLVGIIDITRRRRKERGKQPTTHHPRQETGPSTRWRYLLEKAGRGGKESEAGGRGRGRCREGVS